MLCSKAGGKFQNLSWAATLSFGLLSAAAILAGQARADYFERPSQFREQMTLRKDRTDGAKSGEPLVRESDLHAFCPPAVYADGAYAYQVYSKNGSLAYQASISAINRDCRFDGKGLIHLKIAAAGRVVGGAAAAARGALTLPIEVKVALGDKTLFKKVYQQKTNTDQGAVQFLFSESVAVKKSQATAGTKIFIGFASSGTGPRPKPKAAAPAAPLNNDILPEIRFGAPPGAGQKSDGAKSKKKPFGGIIAPEGGITIPEKP